MSDYDNADRIKFFQLDRVLTALGFVRRDTPEFTAYREEEHDALIILRKLKDDDIVGDPYLVGVRNTIVGKGIASNARLRSLLTRRSIPPMKVALGAFRVKPRKSPAGRQASHGAKKKAGAILNA